MGNRQILRTRNVPYVYFLVIIWVFLHGKEFYFVSYDESHDDYVKGERPIFMFFFYLDEIPWGMHTCK